MQTTTEIVAGQHLRTCSQSRTKNILFQVQLSMDVADDMSQSCNCFTKSLTPMDLHDVTTRNKNKV